MEHNLGSLDRVARIVFALVVGVLFFTKIISGVWSLVLLAIGVVLFLTAVIRFCPIYFALGLRSNGRKA